jgi:hypothetical protein
MAKFVFFIMIIGLISCGQNSNRTNDSKASQVTSTGKNKKTDNALTFINGYIENVNKMKQAVGIIEWVNSNKLSTDGFKRELKRIIEEAYKNDPELGLDADPILDAQDNPDKGFVVESFDDKSNYLIVQGVDWPDFKLTMKIKNENGIWLVDGCGMINIPNEKRAKR